MSLPIRRQTRTVGIYLPVFDDGGVERAALKAHRRPAAGL